MNIMKKFCLIIIIALFASNLSAQKNAAFYKNEVKVSVGDAILASGIWTYDAWGDSRNSAELYTNVSFSYLYRPLKWLWVGGNFVNYFGERIYYKWQEYDNNGYVGSFSKSKIKYCAVIAPEVRFSYMNRRNIILYSALSGGIGFENGYDRKYHKYPELKNFYFQLTYFGFSFNMGKKNNIFLGGELGAGFKGFLNIHGGHRF